MKGSAKVIEMLKNLLTGELTAADIYLLQARMLDDLGYKKLAERLSHEADDERLHADQILKRILFLEGRPQMERRDPIKLVETPLEMMELDLSAEVSTRDNLKAGIKLCFDENDPVSRGVLEKQLYDTEHDHLLWFETQIRLAKDLSVQRWLAENM